MLTETAAVSMALVGRRPCLPSGTGFGIFMARLSTCLFEWDPEDVAALRRAKEGERCATGVPVALPRLSPSTST